MSNLDHTTTILNLLGRCRHLQVAEILLINSNPLSLIHMMMIYTYRVDRMMTADLQWSTLSKNEGNQGNKEISPRILELEKRTSLLLLLPLGPCHT